MDSPKLTRDQAADRFYGKRVGINFLVRDAGRSIGPLPGVYFRQSRESSDVFSRKQGKQRPLPLIDLSAGCPAPVRLRTGPGSEDK